MTSTKVIYGFLGIALGLAGGYFAIQGLAFLTSPGSGWGSVLMVLAGGYLCVRGVRVAGRNFDTSSAPSLPTETRSTSVEDRLDKLERLKRRQMVTSEEYAAKRQDILNDL